MKFRKGSRKVSGKVTYKKELPNGVVSLSKKALATWDCPVIFGFGFPKKHWF